MSYPNSHARPADEQAILGHPSGIGGLNGDPGDPGCNIITQTWLPTTGAPPPWPIFMATSAPGFGGPSDATQAGLLFCTDLADLGFMCVFYGVRTMTDPRLNGEPAAPLPGQTTDGRWSQQYNDSLQVLRSLRASPRTNGFIAGIGGSGSACLICQLLCWPGILEGDKLDAAILMSPPIVFFDLPSRAENENFHLSTCDYARVDPNDVSQSAIDLLNARCPFGYLLEGLKPPPHFHYNGDMESMPEDQFHRWQAEITAHGWDDIYEPYFVVGSHTHSFASWAGPPLVRDHAVPWIQQVYADWVTGGGGITPPPPPPPTGEKVVVAISGLNPETPYTFSAGAISLASGLSGPLTPFDFVSDKDVGGGGGGGTLDPGKGNFVLVPAPGGIPPDLTTKPYWAFNYVDGTKLETNWGVVNPNLNVFTWDVVDTYLLTCSNKGKPGGLAIAAGLTTPAWVYQRGAAKFDLSGGGSMPLPWDRSYLSSYQKMVKTMAARFDTNPGLQYVTIGGIGQFIGSFLVGDADFNALTLRAQADGFSTIIDGWLNGAEQIIDYTIKAFKNTFVFIQLDYPVPIAQGGFNGVMSLVDWASSSFGHRFGLANSNLTGATQNDALIDGLIRTNSQNVQTGYQFAFPSTDPNCDPTQDPLAYDPETGLRNAANAAISLHSAFLEYKESDILIVTPPYPADFGTFQASLKANSHTQ